MYERGWSEQVKPVSDSESDEEDGEGALAGSSEDGPVPPAGGLAFSEASFAEAFEAKRHTVVQGVDDGDGAGAAGMDAGAPAEAEGDAATTISTLCPCCCRCCWSSRCGSRPQSVSTGGFETVVPGAYGTAPGEGSERFSAMAAAEAAKFKKERSAHYNEYEKMQEYKRKLAAGELTDEDY